MVEYFIAAAFIGFIVVTRFIPEGPLPAAQVAQARKISFNVLPNDCKPLK